LTGRSSLRPRSLKPLTPYRRQAVRGPTGRLRPGRWHCGPVVPRTPQAGGQSAEPAEAGRKLANFCQELRARVGAGLGGGGVENEPAESPVTAHAQDAILPSTGPLVGGSRSPLGGDVSRVLRRHTDSCMVGLTLRGG